MISEKYKQLIDTVIGDFNWNNEKISLFFEHIITNYKHKITTNFIKTIHKKYISQFIKENNFIEFKIKNKDSKYYLVRGWSQNEIITLFNVHVYDYRHMNEIITDDDLKSLYVKMSINEISQKFNIEYGRLQRYLKNDLHCVTRSVKESMNRTRVKKKRKKTIIEKYGVENASQSDEIKEKKKQKALEQYGVENVFQAKEIKEKINKTHFRKYGKKRYTQTEEYLDKVKEISLKKYGVDHYTQNEEVKKNTRITNRKKYGHDYFFNTCVFKERSQKTLIKRYNTIFVSQNEDIKEKIKQTCLRKYGKEYYFGSDDYFKKSKHTCLKTYGCENVMQFATIFEKQKKSGYRSKMVKKKNGEIIFLQGYEPVVYLSLLDFFEEDEIEEKSTKMPTIMYNYKGKIRRYYPDFYISQCNLFLEVKSIYTFEKQKEVNLLKQKAVIDSGFDFEFIILEKNEVDDETYRRIGNFRNRRNRK